jgi:hypothetical protein
MCISDFCNIRFLDTPHFAGLDAVLQLVASRLQVDPRQAASDMAEALQRLEERKRRRKDSWDSYSEDIEYECDRSIGEQTITAFRLLCQLAASGACEKSEAVRMGAQLLKFIKCDGIPSVEVAAELAQTAAVLDSDEIDTAIASLVQAWGLKQPRPCMYLVAASSAAGARAQRYRTALMSALGFREQGWQTACISSRG